jgi:NADH dehydrogenase
MKPSKVLILGGTGFVGSALTHKLVRAGHAVLLPSRRPTRYPHLAVLPSVRLVQADIHDSVALRRLTAGADVVINLVGILNEQGHAGAGFRHAHTDLTEKALEACKSSGVGRFLQISSLRAAENAPSHYLRSKGAAERFIRERSGNMNWTIFQPSVIFGRRDSLTNRFAAMLKVLPALPLARAGARFAPVHVEDVVAAIVCSLDRPDTFRMTYELGGPEVMTLKELVLFVARTTGKRRLVFGIPDWAGFLPGKLLSVDNFRSLQWDSVPSTDGFSLLGLTPSSLRNVAPGYLR